MPERIRLLIADDHPIVRAGLRDALSAQSDFEVVGEATAGPETVELTARLQPQAVLMDLHMPEMNGVTAVAQIKAQNPDVHILLLTTHDDDADLLPALQTGATGYLLEDAPREELFRVIRAAAQGESLLPPAVAEERILEARDTSNRQSDSRKQEANPPTGTVTFLFTDIEGSTSMWERDPAQMAAALIRHDEILNVSIEANRGYVFKRVGDAYCAAFITAKEALAAALASQKALFAEPWDENIEVRVRMALHTGAAEERDGDYFGPPVNRVARLLSAGHGGQVLLSGVTYGLVRDNLEPGAELRDLGEHRLKDLRYTERIFQLLAPELPKDFPPLRTFDTRTDEPLGSLRRDSPRRRYLIGLRLPFSKLSSIPPARRRSILVGSLLAGGISFLAGLVIVTGLELSVGKNLSCWVWNDCSTGSSSSDGSNASDTDTLPSILGGGKSVSNSAPQVGPSVPQQQPVPPTTPPASSSGNPSSQPALSEQPSTPSSQQPQENSDGGEQPALSEQPNAAAPPSQQQSPSSDLQQSQYQQQGEYQQQSPPNGSEAQQQPEGS